MPDDFQKFMTRVLEYEFIRKRHRKNKMLVITCRGIHKVQRFIKVQTKSDFVQNTKFLVNKMKIIS